MKLNKQVSRIVKYGVAPGGYKQAFAELSTAGRLDQKILMKLIILLLEKEEERENSIQS